MSHWLKDLNITVRALTHTTERAARRRGVRYFLPALFVDRFTRMGGIDPEVFSRQLDGCRSFSDEAWVAYWRACADERLGVAGDALRRMGGPTPAQVLGPPDPEVDASLRTLLSPAADLFVDRSPGSAAAFIAGRGEDEDPAVALDALVQAITYLFAASWPGWTPRRLEAYADSRRLFDVLIRALAPALGVDVETFTLDLGDDTVTGYAVFPSGVENVPAILLTNGLEGTIEELALPAMRYRPPDVALFVMEMPGTFSYRRPLSAGSERHYRAVIDHISDHPRVDSDNIGMLGLSFGAHWSTRMALRDPRLTAVVSNGGLYDHAFASTASFGMPEIMTWTLQNTTGATNPLELGRKLRSLSLHGRLGDIDIPILAVNGDSDTLVPTQDTIDLAATAPLAELKLYPDDDHCAMGHYDQTMPDATRWLAQHLNASYRAPSLGDHP